MNREPPPGTIWDAIRGEYVPTGMRKHPAKNSGGERVFNGRLRVKAETEVDALQPIDMAEWQGREAPARDWLVDDWLPMRQGSMLSGSGSSGKSLLSQQLLTTVAMGLVFFGLATTQANGIYLTCEDPPEELWRRQVAICAALNVPIASLIGRVHLISWDGETDTLLCWFDDKGVLHPTARFRQIVEAAKRLNCRFIILDNVAHFVSEEVIRNRVAQFVSLMNRLAREIDGVVIFLAHTNKANQEYSGSTSWENQVRTRLYLEAANDDDENGDPDARTLRRSKANYAKRGAEIKMRWHRWAFVAPEVAAHDMQSELARVAEDSRDNALFITCLRERNRQHRPVSERPSVSYAPKVFAGMAESKHIGKARLERAMDRLFRIGQIERGFLFRDRGKGRDVEGLRERSDFPQTTPQNPPQTLPPTPSPNPQTELEYSMKSDPKPPPELSRHIP